MTEALTAPVALWLVAALVLVIAALTGVVAGGVRYALLRWQVLDHPNARSSHTVSTPRGGGIAILFVLLPAWLALIVAVPATRPALLLIPAGAVLLAIMSWLDDLNGLHPLPRFVAQVVAATVAITQLEGVVFQGLLPPLLDHTAAIVLLVWFVNLFNFMDGIDGITAVEAIAVGSGLFALGLVLDTLPATSWQALLIAATALGFLVWNWSPARLFLGDVGSVPIGFLLGWLLLEAATRGAWAAALILALYYLADATITLLRRLVAGRNIFRPHREHFYQRAVGNGHSHATVAAFVALLNGALIAHALVAATWPRVATIPALLSAGALVAGLMAWMTYVPARR